MNQIQAACQLAGKWWAERLSSKHANKREVFAAAVANHCEATMRASKTFQCYLEVDYDPKGPMLAAVQETIDPKCTGVFFSAKGILPQKHELLVQPLLLTPKEGYGHWTTPIPVPRVSDA